MYMFMCMMYMYGNVHVWLLQSNDSSVLPVSWVRDRIFEALLHLLKRRAVCGPLLKILDSISLLDALRKPHPEGLKIRKRGKTFLFPNQKCVICPVWPLNTRIYFYPVHLRV